MIAGAEKLDYDLIVVGAGNAGMCAALSAKERGAERILVVERSIEQERGGNSRFTAGAFRIAYSGVDDLLEVMPDLTEDEIENADFGTYSNNNSSTTWPGSPTIGLTPTW